MLKVTEGLVSHSWRYVVAAVAVVVTGLAIWTVGGPARQGGNLLMLREPMRPDPRCPDHSESVVNFARAALHRVGVLARLLLERAGVPEPVFREYTPPRQEPRPVDYFSTYKEQSRTSQRPADNEAPGKPAACIIVYNTYQLVCQHIPSPLAGAYCSVRCIKRPVKGIRNAAWSLVGRGPASYPS